MRYWLRISRAMPSHVATIPSGSAGKKASPPVARARRLRNRDYGQDRPNRRCRWYRSPRWTARLSSRHRQRVCARVVAAIADHDQGLLFAAAQADLFQAPRRSHRKARSDPQWRLPDGGFQLIGAIGEMDCVGKARIHPLIESDCKHFVFGVARCGQKCARPRLLRSSSGACFRCGRSRGPR